MELSKFFPSIVSILVTGAVASGLTLLLEKVFKKPDEKAEVECVLFSPIEGHWPRSGCSRRACGRPACAVCGYEKLSKLLRKTKYKVDICMYLITHLDLASTIITLVKQGVNVRVIVDRQMSNDAYKCKTWLFIQEGVPLKCTSPRSMMHNKFMIIDNQIVVSGSCNWTYQGLMNNFENVLIIRNEEIANKYGLYFEELWAREPLVVEWL